MNIDDFLQNRKENIKNENSELFVMPKKDRGNDMPHIKKKYIC